MKIEMMIPQSEIFQFLQNKGYEIKSWLYEFTDETFPNGVTSHQSWTFTACKASEKQSEETIYTRVFNNEIKQLLNQL